MLLLNHRSASLATCVGLALVACGGDPVEQPPQLSICRLARQATRAVVNATVSDWASATVGDFTRVDIDIATTLAGSTRPGPLSVFVAGSIDGGMSRVGNLERVRAEPGVLFLNDIEGSRVGVESEGGLFWRDGDSLFNIGRYEAGIAQSDFDRELAASLDGGTCPEETADAGS